MVCNINLASVMISDWVMTLGFYICMYKCFVMSFSIKVEKYKLRNFGGANMSTKLHECLSLGNIKIINNRKISTSLVNHTKYAVWLNRHIPNLIKIKGTYTHFHIQYSLYLFLNCVSSPTCFKGEISEILDFSLRPNVSNLTVNLYLISRQTWQNKAEEKTMKFEVLRNDKNLRQISV